MMSIMKYQKLPVFFLYLFFACAACNKDEIIAEKAVHVVINGYNGSDDKLQVNIDTTRYEETSSNAKSLLQPASLVGFNAVYTYRPGSGEQVLTIKNPLTDSIVYSSPLPASGTKMLINFLYIDGKIQELHPPAANASTNKLGFYVRYQGNEAPFDISLYRRDAATGMEYRHYLAKNVRPGNWIYIDYVPVENFINKNDVNNSTVYFTKAGTVDQWAFLDDETQSKLSVQGLGFPKEDEKGLVQPYFIIPRGWELGFSRLFFYPDKK